MPTPLTQTPAAKLDWSRPGTPAASNFGDIYFSTDGGLDETRTVFLNGCGLPERWELSQNWSNPKSFTIAELGFGSGLNFLATWQMWNAQFADSQLHSPRHLHFVSIEKFPFDRTQLTRALSAWPELASLSKQLIAAWPGRVRGIHRLEFGDVTLTLIHDDVAAAFDQIDNLRADAWFLDGFSPAGNPAMWNNEVIKKIAAISAPLSRLATFSVAGSVRKALSEAGFVVEKKPGFGRKRHRLEARLEANSIWTKTKPINRALIVGAGIAGRSLARALHRRSIDFDIIDNRSHPAASGNPAALVKPRFDLQDRPESRFFLSAYLHALRSYPETAILEHGIRQIPKSEKDATRFKKLLEQAPLGRDQLRWENEALFIDSALVIEPAKIFADFDVKHADYCGASDSERYSHVFVAAGFGIREIATELGLRFSRGQLSWAQPIWDHSSAYGGYAINIDSDCLVGATHDRLDERDPFELRQEDDEKNLSALANISGKTIVARDRASRASVRVTTHNTLPLLAKLNEQTWAMTGLGSRGFTFAPLLAEALIADLCGEVGPLDKKVRGLFST